MEIMRNNFGVPTTQKPIPGGFWQKKTMSVTAFQVRAALGNYLKTLTKDNPAAKLLATTGDLTLISGTALKIFRFMLPKTSQRLFSGKTGLADEVGTNLIITGIWAKILAPVTESLISKQALKKLVSLIDCAKDLQPVAEGLIEVDEISGDGLLYHPLKFALARVLFACTELPCYENLITALQNYNSGSGSKREQVWESVATNFHLADIFLLSAGGEI